MIIYSFEKVIAEGSATINPETGETTQLCSVVTKISGLVIGDKLLTDSVIFTVGSDLSIINAWLDIRDNQAPQWVSNNYKEI